MKQLKSAYSSTKPSISIFVKAVLLSAFSFALYTFAKKQDIWIDETTQLSGITLKFGDMLHWLSGQDLGRFGVPGDRMPPVSYILDWAWLRLFGPSALGFRLFHASFLLAGVILLVITAGRSLNLTASFVALAILGFSPKMVGTAVEIRAYPFFFAVTCVQTAIFIRLVNDRNRIDRRLLASFIVISITAIYTHFFELVSGYAFFLTLGLAYIRQRAMLLEIVLAVAIVGVASVGLLPFVLSAASNSSSSGEVVNMHQYGVYLFELFGDSANIISRSAAILFFGGVLALLSLSAVNAAKRIINDVPQSVDWLLLVIIAGVSATLGASLFMKNFDVLKASYSIWIFAPLVLFISSGAVGSGRSGYWNGIYGVAAVVAVVGAAVSTFTFLFHASEFIHGPGRFVGAIYDRTLSPKAVIYDTGAQWEWAYFPLEFSHGGAVSQYRFADDGDLVRLLPGSAQPIPQRTIAAVAPYSELVLVDLQLRTYNDIRRCREKACPQFHPGSVEATLIASGHWRKIAVARQFGLYDAQVMIFKRLD